MQEGAEFGKDFQLEDLLKEAAISMIEHAPVMRLSEMTADMYAPALARKYSAQQVLHGIGDKFGDAVVFAARANAAFDLDDLERAVSTNEMFLSPFRRRMISQFESTERVFDKEHPRSAAILNEMLLTPDILANNIAARITEQSSDSHDALQAADFTAGLASEVMMNETNDKEKATPTVLPTGDL